MSDDEIYDLANKHCIGSDSDEQVLSFARECFAAGRASVERIEVKAEYTTGHCANHAVRGGCQLPNIQCGYPECDRKRIEAAPSQEPAGYLCQGIFYNQVEEQPENSIPLYTHPSDAAAQIAELKQCCEKYQSEIADITHNWQITYDRLWDEAKEYREQIAKLEEFNQECRQALLRCNEQIAKLEADNAALRLSNQLENE